MKGRSVLMNYMLFNGRWYCQFLEEDCKTSLPKTLNFLAKEKVKEMALKGGAEANLAGIQALDYGISIGRGAVWLNLTPEQYGKLR